jgi:hypothetical protein
MGAETGGARRIRSDERGDISALGPHHTSEDLSNLQSWRPCGRQWWALHLSMVGTYIVVFIRNFSVQS